MYETRVTDTPLSNTPDGPRALAIMAKAPVAGRSKTRLMPIMSAQAAADIAEAFLLDTVALATVLAHKLDGLVAVVAGAPSVDNTYFDEMTFDSRSSDSTESGGTTSDRTAPDHAASDFGNLEHVATERVASDQRPPVVRHLDQRGDGLNQRLDSVLADLLEQGFEQVIAINADSPTLPVGLLEQAFSHLDDPNVDVVFGPAEDGGYYLIGCKAHHPALVRNVTMSTPTVLQDSLAIASSEGLQVALLEPWYDVDEPDDLERLRADVEDGLPCGPNTLAFLRAHPHLGRLDTASTPGPAREPSQATTNNQNTGAR